MWERMPIGATEAYPSLLLRCLLFGVIAAWPTCPAELFAN